MVFRYREPVLGATPDGGTRGQGRRDDDASPGEEAFIMLGLFVNGPGGTDGDHSQGSSEPFRDSSAFYDSSHTTGNYCSSTGAWSPCIGEDASMRLVVNQRAAMAWKGSS